MKKNRKERKKKYIKIYIKDITADFSDNTNSNIRNELFQKKEKTNLVRARKRALKATKRSFSFPSGFNHQCCLEDEKSPAVINRR